MTMVLLHTLVRPLVCVCMHVYVCTWCIMCICVCVYAPLVVYSYIRNITYVYFYTSPSMSIHILGENPNLLKEFHTALSPDTPYVLQLVMDDTGMSTFNLRDKYGSLLETQYVQHR